MRHRIWSGAIWGLVLAVAGTSAGCGSSANSADSGTDSPSGDSVGAVEHTAEDLGPSDGAGNNDGPADQAGAGGGCPLTMVYAAPCNTIIPAGPVATSTCSSAALPQAQGGTIADGTYVLQNATWYGLCQPAQTVQATWVICGGLWNLGEDSSEVDAGTLQVNYSETTTGMSVSLNPICSSQGPMAGMMRGYSAAAGTLSLFTTYGSSTLVTVYKAQ
jgi:hypothetical protein